MQQRARMGRSPEVVFQRAEQALKEAHKASGSGISYKELLKSSPFLDSFRKGMRILKYTYDKAKHDLKYGDKARTKYNPKKQIPEIQALEKSIYGAKKASGGSVKGRPAKRSAENS